VGEGAEGAILDRDRFSAGSKAIAQRLTFGPFSLGNFGEALHRGDTEVPLGSRARQILACLAERPGDVVSKAEIMEKVWPGTTVVENNLTVHIAALRQALGDGRNGVRYIVNIPGRGYRFVAPVQVETRLGEVARSSVRLAPTNLPSRVVSAIGLAQPTADLFNKMLGANVVTVCGPAGVGKSTLALHVAQQRRETYSDGAWLIDLAPLQDAKQVAQSIARAMGIELGQNASISGLGEAISRRKTLVILDNCEHLIETVATLAVMISGQSPGVVLLTTSRERLRISDEVVYDLSPLQCPPPGASLNAHEALGYSAVELFVERILAARSDFSFDDESVEAAVSICRRLDGLPLAIEFASTLVGTFGLNGLAKRMDDLCMLMQTDRRGGALRHRTLNAALDWSYDLLEDAEQICLRRLSALSGSFTLERAAEAIGDPDLGEVGALLAKLHAKSLIARETSQLTLRFRLLETTRAFALEKWKALGGIVQFGPTILKPLAP